MEILVFSHPRQHLGIYFLIIVILLDVISHYGFNFLVFKKLFISHSCLLEKISIKSFDHFYLDHLCHCVLYEF